MTGQAHWLPLAWVLFVAGTLIAYAYRDALIERRRRRH